MRKLRLTTIEQIHNGESTEPYLVGRVGEICEMFLIKRTTQWPDGMYDVIFEADNIVLLPGDVPVIDVEESDE